MIYLIAIAVFVGLLVALTMLLGVAERYLVNYGTCTIRINNGERELSVDGGQSLLSSLYSNEVFIPSACGGKGTCGFCKITVLSGGGPVLPTETTYLTRKEQRSGLRLACQVKVRQDIEARVPDQYLNVRLFNAEVASTRDLTYDIKEIRMKLLDPSTIEQQPGQYVQVEVPAPGEKVFRAYSISSPAHDNGVVELLVRLVPGGLGSTYLHNLQAGDPVTFTGPFGEFELDEDPATEIICVGGGCGMAPMKNIIHTIYHHSPERNCWLFFGCRTTKDIFDLQELQELSKRHPNFHVIYALSGPMVPDEKWDGETGFIHLAVDKYLHGQGRRQAFLCGPEPMIKAVTTVLKTKGLTDDRIFYDKF